MKHRIEETPHPYKKGDRVLLNGQRGTVRETSWSGDLPLVGVKIDADTGKGLYRISARVCVPISAVDLLGEIET